MEESKNVLGIFSQHLQFLSYCLPKIYLGRYRNHKANYLQRSFADENDISQKSFELINDTIAK